MRIHLNANPKKQTVSFLGISLKKNFFFNAKQKLTQGFIKGKSGIKVEQLRQKKKKEKKMLSKTQAPKQADKNVKAPQQGAQLQRGH